MGKYKQSFLAGTMILLAAGIINRLLGFVPRITLPRVIGAEGVGLYQMGYPFLIVVLTLATGGIPLAVAKLVAEAESAGNEARVRLVLKTALGLTLMLGIFFTAVCIFAAPWITAHLLTEKRVYYTFLCMSPIILIAAVSSVLRGYFQGRQNMIPTATSQTVETVIRIVAVLLFAYIMLPYGIEYAAAGAMTGVLAGEAVGLLVLGHHYWQNKRAGRLSGKPGSRTEPLPTGSRRQTLKQLFRISVPVTGNNLVGSGTYFLESVLIMQSLAAAGIATSLATAQYGALQGMVIPILMLPNALTASLAVSLVPSLSEAAARNDRKTIHKRLHQSIRLALVTGAPFAVFMFILAEPICYYLYNNSEIGSMLRMMAPVALLIYLQAPLRAALQALDRPGTALVNTLFGAVIKLILIVLLASNPKFGILGAVLAANINIMIVTLLHWISVSRLLNFSVKGAEVAKIGIAMLATALVCHMAMYGSWNGTAFARFIASLAAGSFVYLCAVAWMGLIDRYDFRRIPWPRLRR